MIPLKKLTIPRPTHRALRIGLEEGGRVLWRKLYGFRREGGALIPAETAEPLPVSTSLRGAKRMFSAEGKLFIGMNGFYSVYPDEGAFAGMGGLNGVISYWGEDGVRDFYLLWDTGMTRYRSPEQFGGVEGAAGGDCMAVHRERVFIAKGSTLRYSVPLGPTQFSEEGRCSGSVALSGTEGNIHAMISFRDALYCFREHGLCTLEADADDLDFRFRRVLFDGETIYPGSAADCGSYLAFLTERGLHVVDGSVRLVRTSFGVTPVRPVQAAGYAGKYFFLAQKPGGEGCIYVYDPVAGDYLIEEEAELLTSAYDGVYLVHGTTLSRLTPQTIEKEKRISYLLDIGGSNGAPRMVAGVTVHGKGKFTVSLETEAGRISRETVAGKRLLPERFLRGETLRCDLTTSDPEAAVEAVTVHFREVSP